MLTSVFTLSVYTSIGLFVSNAYQALRSRRNQQRIKFGEYLAPRSLESFIFPYDMQELKNISLNNYTSTCFWYGRETLPFTLAEQLIMVFGNRVLIRKIEVIRRFVKYTLRNIVMIIRLRKISCMGHMGAHGGRDKCVYNLN